VSLVLLAAVALLEDLFNVYFLINLLNGSYHILLPSVLRVLCYVRCKSEVVLARSSTLCV
jgi:hypothetical protein